MNETEVYGVKVTHWPDNTITIPRRDSRVIKYLNNCCDPADGNELRWYKRVGGAIPFANFLKVPCKYGYIVGKGPSLDVVRPGHFKNISATVIAINDSIEKIETLKLWNPVFMLQQDIGAKTSEIDYAPVLMPPRIQHLYPEAQRYIFEPLEHVNANETLSAQIAIALLKAKGCETIGMVSFDACVDGTLGNAQCARQEGRDTSRYLGFCSLIKETATSRHVALEWITPKEKEDEDS